MARKLIDQEEVARILGVSTDEVASLRDRKKLFPYRDGSDWKFKPDDVERLRQELQDERASKSGAEVSDWSTSGDLEEPVELELTDDLDSILLSEVEMGKSSTEGASTIIGKVDEGSAGDIEMPSASTPKAPKTPKAETPGDSAVLLGGGSGIGSDLGLAPGSTAKPIPGAGAAADAAKGDSGLALAGDSGFALAGDSGFALAGDSGVTLGSDVKLITGGSEVGKKSPGGSSDKLFGSDALKLDDDELSLIDSSPGPSAKPVEGSKKMSGSSIKLGDEELEVVLGGSNIGSDVTQSPTDSGIQLISASDSGLSLDQPVALGSSAKRLLDIGDSGVADESPSTHGDEPKAEDDFLLSAMDEGGEESSDSGSQVIALDTDDELSSGMFAPAAGAATMIEEEPAGGGLSSGSLGMAPTLAASPAMMAMPATVEAPYTGANVAILAVCAVLLLLCGMMSFDLMRNMWSWDGPYTINSSIMDSLDKILPFK
jgi:hypothetical protein